MAQDLEKKGLVILKIISLFLNLIHRFVSWSVCLLSYIVLPIHNRVCPPFVRVAHRHNEKKIAFKVSRFFITFIIVQLFYFINLTNPILCLLKDKV